MNNSQPKLRSEKFGDDDDDDDDDNNNNNNTDSASHCTPSCPVLLFPLLRGPRGI